MQTLSGSTGSESSTVSERLYRSQQHKVLGGVCSGLALSRGYSITLVRMVAIGLACLSAVGVLVYLVALFLLPKASKIGVVENAETPHDPLKRSRSEKMLGGVCAGLAKMLKLDVALVRIVYVCLILIAGVGILPYLYAWIILPSDA